MELSLTIAMMCVAAIAAFTGVCSLAGDLRRFKPSRASERLDREFRQEQRDSVQRSMQQSILFRDLQKAADENSASQSQSIRERLAKWLEQSGLSLKVDTLISWCIGLCAGCGGLIGLARASWGAGFAAGLIGLAAPLLYVRHKRRQRMDKIRQLLIEAFETIARVLRAGQTLPQALNVVAAECSRPLADEFSLCFEQQKLGLSPDVAFQELADRVGVLELQLFALVAQIQQSTGAGVGELVGKLAEMVRERERTRYKIKALTAESRLQASVLLGLPPVVLVIMLIVKRDYVQSLLQYPTLLAGTFLMQIVGALWIRRIVNIDD